MTATDKLTQALIDLLDANKPHASITVHDGRSLEEVELPLLVVDCGSPEPHSLAMPGVNRIPVQVVLRVHAGDSGDTTVKAWLDTVEKLIYQPDVIRGYITASGNGLQCDMIQFSSSGTRWEERIFEAVFSGEALVVRLN